MKNSKRGTAILILFVAALIVAGYFGVVRDSGAATQQDLEQAKKELKAQIDSILRNQDSIKAEIRAIKKNTDTLKAGQEVIFKTMKENEGKKSIFDYLF